MSTLVTRMMTALSLVALLFVAVVVVRLQTWSSESSFVSVTVPDAFFIPTLENTNQPSLDNVYAAVALPEFDLPVVAKMARAPRAPKVRFMQVNKEVKILDEVFSPVEMGEVESVDGQWRQLQGATEVPVTEPVQLQPVEMNAVESTSLVALMDTIVLPGEDKTEVARAPAVEPVEVVEDVVATKLAKDAPATDVVDAEPSFIEIPQKKEPETPKVARAVEAPAEAAQAEESNEYSIPEGWDLVDNQKATPPDTKIKVDDQLVTAGYIAPAGNTRVLQQAPTVAVSTQPTLAKHDDYPAPAPRRTDKVNTHLASVTISAYSVGMGKSTSALGGVEVRAKDDDSQSWRTANKGDDKGSVTIQEQVSNGPYTRSLFVNENEEEYVPTHTDVVMASEGRVEIPVFTQEKLAAFGDVAIDRPSGSVLVELDETTETVTLDGVVRKTLRLTENFISTKGDDYRYLLFLGVEAGNRIMTISQGNNRRTNRIIHVHAGAMTFDNNIYGQEQRLVVNLAEEDLMSRKKRPLVLSGDKVQQFFTGEKAQKLSPSKYAFRSSINMAGTRQYMALSHQGEDIFVGVSGSQTAVVPSEAFMREVIRKFHITGNANSCIVQVNLDKAVKRYQVISESYDEAHTSYGLVLDEDGQFYESMGEHSRRLFIMSESQTGKAESANARINIRLEYQDGSSRSFQSYCSPNSYLVEQL